MRFLDCRGRWLGTPVVETSIAVLQQACEAEHQRYLLFSTLLRHVAMAEQLAPAERAAVLELAMGEGRQLEAGLAAPALLLALRELPAVIASHAGAGEEVAAMPFEAAAVLPLPVPAGAAAAEDPSSEDGLVNGAAMTAVATPGGVQEIELPRLPPVASGRTAAAASAAAADARYRPVDLQPLVLAAVQRLALRVEDSGQLLEAVGSTITKLRGAAPISTAALQCCVSAAEAVAHLAPRVSSFAGWGGCCCNWGPCSR